MKKAFALLLALCMVFALCACGQTEAPAQTETPAEPQTEAPAEAPAAIFCGKLYIPPPIIELTTMAASAHTPNPVPESGAAEVSADIFFLSAIMIFLF